MWPVLLLFVTLVWSAACPLASRDDLLPCVTSLLDGDHDESITSAELTAFLAAPPACVPAAWNTTGSSFLTAANIMALCDVDLDGNLTVADWAHNDSCFRSRARQTSLCRMCAHCGA